MRKNLAPAESAGATGAELVTPLAGIDAPNSVHSADAPSERDVSIVYVAVCPPSHTMFVGENESTLNGKLSGSTGTVPSRVCHFAD